MSTFLFQQIVPGCDCLIQDILHGEPVLSPKFGENVQVGVMVEVNSS